ncbi:MAG: hypothetical protein DSY43_02850 [Gammaproteobacteria bacterium]|nr:MAG: hypothetical protein DSY43_02850 [Gammaproteobacteria bacterium]
MKMTIKKIFGNLFLLLIGTPIFALTTANVNQTWFYPGEQIILTLSSDGNKVAFPLMNNIAGYGTLSASDAQNISIINGKRIQKTSRSYVFKPTKSLTIPAYTVMVDGTQQTTQPIEITFRKPTQSKVGDDYILQMQIDKPTFFLGDKANLKVIFKVKKTLLNNQINLSQPEVKDLLFIKGRQTNSADQDYNIVTLNFKVSASNFGTFTLPSLVATIGNQNRDIFGNFFSMRQNTLSKKKYSNALTLTVKPLPDALRIFGDFSIKASVDKTQTKEGDAVNLTVAINGEGNFEDIENFNLSIDNATIYSDDAIFDYKGWQQKFAIVGAQNFVIPAFKFDYFDKKTQTKKSLSTQPIKIQVTAKIQPAKRTVTQALIEIDNKIPVNDKIKYYYLLLGIVIGILIGVLVSIFRHQKKQLKNQSLIKQIKSSKGDKQLFDVLLPLNLTQLEPVLQQLEANIYKGERQKINKKEIINVIQSNS